jgi:hypothetical protein
MLSGAIVYHWLLRWRRKLRRESVFVSVLMPGGWVFFVLYRIGLLPEWLTALMLIAGVIGLTWLLVTVAQAEEADARKATP